MTERLEKFVKHFLPIFYFMVAVMFYLRTYDSCQIKITIVHIFGAILLMLWLVKIVQEWNIELYKKNLVIVLPILLIILSNVVSHLRSHLKYASEMELIRKSIYFGIALLALKEMNTEEKIHRLVKWLLFACFLSTFYGLIQYIDYKYSPGLDPFIWRGAFGGRVFSTFGNPNFYGDFLTVMNPIILAMYLKTRKIPYLLMWLLLAFNSMYTYSKGAWIGFAVGFIVFCTLAVFFFTHLQKGNTKKIFIALIVFVLISSVGAVGYYSKARTDSLKFRIYTWLSCWEMINTHPVLGTGIGTFYVTYPAWRRPQIFFIEGRHNTETDHPENEYLEVWYDEGIIGFGIFLWLIITTGAIGLKALKLFSQSTVVDDKGRKKYIVEDNRAYYMLGFLSSFFGMLSHNFVCVSLRFVSSGVFLWLLVGLIAALVIHNPLPKRLSNGSSDRLERFIIACFWAIVFYWWKMNINICLACGAAVFIISEIVEFRLVPAQGPFKNETADPGADRQFPKFLLSGIIVALTFYLCLVFRGYFLGDLHHNIAIFHSKRGEWSQALENYNIVTEKNYGFIMAHYFMGNVFNDRWILNREFHPEWGDPENEQPTVIIDTGKKGRIDPERSIAKYNDVWSIAPDYVQSFHQAGLIYLKLGEQFRNAGDIATSEKYWTKALELFEKYHLIDPIFPPNYYRMAWIYMKRGNIVRAEESYLRHIYSKDMLFKNGSQEMKWVYEQMNRPMDGIKECGIHNGSYHNGSWEDWGKRRNSEYSETYLNLGNLKYFTGDNRRAEYYYSKAVEINPDNTGALKNLAVIYSKNGKASQAIELWKKVGKLSPDDSDVKKVFPNGIPK